ncbi:MAG: GNAT family N-acetyltransferase [Gammaproteobacteria bacterium]|nr:MAG: GNAT family N-acetyltransferase [Gammaproteobacteria bacterium]
MATLPAASVVDSRAVRVRPARLDDIPALLELEAACFETDRLSRRSLKHLLTRAHAVTLVAESGGVLLGYVLLLFHRGTALARLYSMAVAPAARGRGLGRLLLERAEQAAHARGFLHLRLEVRSDNPTAIALYERAGYRYLHTKPDYYEDHQSARCYEKRLAPAGAARLLPVPYYPQSTDFTCGPAALMMALAHLGTGVRLDLSTELALWREATTIYMSAGHGGCGPHGLALAAWRRGLAVTLRLNRSDRLFIDSVRDPAKKRVIDQVQADFEAELAQTDVALRVGAFTAEDIEQALAEGAVPIVLVSTYRLNRNKAPHWVTVTGLDERHVYVHDPEPDEAHDKTPLDCQHVPIPRAVFSQMSRFGRDRLRAMLILARRGGG